MRSPVPSTTVETASRKATCMEVAAKARLSAHGEVPHIPAVIKSTECARVRSGLSVKAGTSLKIGASVGGAIAQFTGMEFRVTELTASRDEGLMVEERSAAMP